MTDGTAAYAATGLDPLLPLEVTGLGTDVPAMGTEPGTVPGGLVEAGLPDVLSDLLRSLVDAAAAHPWPAGFLALLVLGRMVRAVRTAVHGRHPRDPQRLFVGADRATLLARAGRRCEHHSWLSGRCPTTERLQADHVHPHSRGGATSLANGQVLCGRHNARKANRIPWTWELDRLARRRQAYFPPGTPTQVVRHREATAASA
ncbi:HNH endonuclease [Blastococcus sp. SYSU DS0539]